MFNDPDISLSDEDENESVGSGEILEGLPPQLPPVLKKIPRSVIPQETLPFPELVKINKKPIEVLVAPPPLVAIKKTMQLGEELHKPSIKPLATDLPNSPESVSEALVDPSQSIPEAKTIYVDKVVERIVYVDKIVEKIVVKEVIKEVVKERSVPVYRSVVYPIFYKDEYSDGATRLIRILSQDQIVLTEQLGLIEITKAKNDVIEKHHPETAGPGTAPRQEWVGRTEWLRKFFDSYFVELLKLGKEVSSYLGNSIYTTALEGSEVRITQVSFGDTNQYLGAGAGGDRVKDVIGDRLGWLTSVKNKAERSKWITSDHINFRGELTQRVYQANGSIVDVPGPNPKILDKSPIIAASVIHSGRGTSNGYSRDVHGVLFALQIDLNQEMNPFLFDMVHLGNIL